MATIPIALPAPSSLPGTPHSSPLRGLRITFGGLLCVAVVILVALAGLNSEANLLYLLSGISVGMLLLSAVAPIAMVRGIEVDRLVPDAVVAGRPFRITYIVRNRRRLGNAWSILISERPLPRRSRYESGRCVAPFPDAFADALAPGEEKRIDVMSVCRQRGRLELPGVRVTSRFPFGLFSCHIDFPIAAEVLVYPPLGRFRYDPWRDYRAASSPSNQSIRHRSGHEEFYGVREYRQGDNLRWIHWRQSARTGELVVREMLPLKPTQLIVLVDPWSGPASDQSVRPGAAPLDRDAERVISAAATALCDALERGHRVGLVCRAARPIMIPPNAGRAQRQRILHELATATPGAPEPLDAIVGTIRWSAGWHARCLLCSAALGEPHERVVKFLGGRAEALAILSPQKEEFALMFEAHPQTPGGGAL
jgi:uncharacterized protein (DUF58 family)